MVSILTYRKCRNYSFLIKILINRARFFLKKPRFQSILSVLLGLLMFDDINFYIKFVVKPTQLKLLVKTNFKFSIINIYPFLMF